MPNVPQKIFNFSKLTEDVSCDDTHFYYSNENHFFFTVNFQAYDLFKYVYVYKSKLRVVTNSCCILY